MPFCCKKWTQGLRALLPPFLQRSPIPFAVDGRATSPGLGLGVLEVLQVWAVCAPAPRAHSTRGVIKFLLIKPEPPAPAATRVLWFVGFSSPESITVGYVFRDGRGKAIQLQPFCIPLILGLLCAGSFPWHKFQQPCAAQIHAGSCAVQGRRCCAGLGLWPVLTWGSAPSKCAASKV